MFQYCPKTNLSVSITPSVLKNTEKLGKTFSRFLTSNEMKGKAF